VSLQNRRDTHAAVAAKLSTRLALVMIDNTMENPAVNAAIIPSLAGMLRTIYNITILKTGSREESIVATIAVNRNSELLRYVRISVSR
jgi:hypothetical protein